MSACGQVSSDRLYEEFERRYVIVFMVIAGDIGVSGRLINLGVGVAEFHFVQDYERLVARLIASHPLDEAMEMAVGGKYLLLGEIERSILSWAGLTDDMTVIDLGCGSGRLAHALGKEFKIDYTGIDIVQSLLDYAKTKSPSNYRFILNRNLTLPVKTGTADIICAFSVFTHLLHAESYIYLEEMRRALKPTGKVIFSFIEFSEKDHWPAFEYTVAAQRNSTVPHLNTFIERSSISVWCEKLGFNCEQIIDSAAAPYGGPALGHSLAVLGLK